MNTKTLRDNFYIDTEYEVIYEDKDILVIDKPAPLAVHPVGVYAELNLHTLLKNDPRWTDVPMKLVHRLDAETSGVLVIARNYEAARSLGKQFLAGQVHKSYEAVVFGRPANSTGDITFPLGFDASSGFQTVRIHDAEKGEVAQTRYEVLNSGDEFSHVKLTPFTGRTHQLRAHMALIGHPIVGDKIYVDLEIFRRYVLNGLDDEMIARLKLPRLALHASQVSFTHPTTKENVTFVSFVAPLISEFIETHIPVNA